MASTQRINLGFQGGQVLPLRVTAEALQGLRRALEKGEWHELTTEDGAVTLNLSQVVYLDVDADERGVGFS